MLSVFRISILLIFIFSCSRESKTNTHNSQKIPSSFDSKQSGKKAPTTSHRKNVKTRNSTIILKKNLKSEGEILQKAKIVLHRATINIATVGDLIFHTALQKYGRRKSGGYEKIFSYVTPIFKKVDISIGNLESPMNSRRGMRDYPHFNLPPKEISIFNKIGFTHFNIANNHIMDQGSRGILDTIHYLKKNGFIAIGAGLRKDPRLIIQKINGYRIGFTGFTFATNRPVGHTKKYWVQTLELSDKSWVKSMQKTVSKWKSQVDFLVIILHWGPEYKTKPYKSQKYLAKLWSEAGADVLIGHHTHYLAKTEYIKNKNGSRSLVLYSLGNILSNQGISTPFNYSSKLVLKNDGVIALISLSKDSSGKNVISGGIIPTFCERTARNKEGRTYKIRILEDEIRKYEKIKKLSKDAKIRYKTFKTRFNYIKNLMKTLPVLSSNNPIRGLK